MQPVTIPTERRLIVALLLSIAPFGALADHQVASRAPVTLTFTAIEEFEPGKE